VQQQLRQRPPVQSENRAESSQSILHILKRVNAGMTLARYSLRNQLSATSRRPRSIDIIGEKAEAELARATSPTVARIFNAKEDDNVRF